MESVRVTVGFTQNIGNFENIKTEVAIESTPLDGESHEEAIDRVTATLEPKFIEKAREVYDTLSGDARKNTQINPKG